MRCARRLAGPWRVVGESAAGHPFAGALGPGEAVRISTGALMPAGGERGAAAGRRRRATATRSRCTGDGEPSARHIRRAASTFATGDALLAAGTRIGPAQIALAIAAGHGATLDGRPPAARRGDRQRRRAGRRPGALRTTHQLPASNGAMLAAMAAPLAASVEPARPGARPAGRAGRGARRRAEAPTSSSPAAAPRSATTTWSARRSRRGARRSTSGAWR